MCTVEQNSTTEPVPPQELNPGQNAVIPAGVLSGELVRDRAAAARYWMLNASHSVIDIFPIFLTSLMIALQDRLELSGWQVTWVYMATPIFSGGIQPIFAWLGDKYDTRIAGPLGLALGAVCISSIGLAQNFWQLVALQIVGVIGTGMYHPAMAALAGQIGGRAFRHGRGFAVSLFIASGMLGQSIGPIISTRMNDLFGMGSLVWMIPVGLVASVILYRITRTVGHRHANHHEMRARISIVEVRARRWVVGLLATQNALRFTTNIGLFVLFNYWAKSKLSGVSQAASASNINGNLSAAMTVGMGLSAIIAGRMIRPGSEKWPFAWSALIGAIAVGAMGWIGDWGWSMRADGHVWGMWPVYFAACCTAIGFFATIPASVGLAQRLLPGHTAIASALMMGVGWVVSSISEPLARLVFLGGVPLDRAAELSPARLNSAFVWFAALLVIAACLSAAMPRSVLRRAARHG